MTPEKKAQLQTYIEAIAEILYAESDLADLHTLEGIELTVRDKIQEHVSPSIGCFLSAQLAALKPAESEHWKVRWES